MRVLDYDGRCRRKPDDEDTVIMTAPDGGQYDLVLLNRVLSERPLDEAIKLVASLPTMLKRGGRVVIWENSLEWAARVILGQGYSYELMDHLFAPSSVPPRRCGFTMQALTSLIRETGLVIVSADTQPYLIYQNEDRKTSLADAHVIVAEKRHE